MNNAEQEETIEEAKKAISSFITKKDRANFCFNIWGCEMKNELLNVQTKLQQIRSVLNGLLTIADYKTGQENYAAIDFQSDCENICSLAIQKIQEIENELEEMEKTA